MSKESVEAFVKRLSEDPQLEQQVQSQTKDAPDPVAILVTLAAANGYEFTAEEFLQAIPEDLLSEAELEGVAGGIDSTLVVRRTRSLPDFGAWSLATPSLNTPESDR